MICKYNKAEFKNVTFSLFGGLIYKRRTICFADCFDGKDIYRFCLSLTGNADEAEELLQETFYRAFLSADRFEGRSTVYTWLYQIGKNAWLKECRRRKRFCEQPVEELVLTDTAPTPEDFILSFELCTVDGDSWIVRPDIYELSQLQDFCENEDSTQLWDYLILNNIQNILIPESAWTQFCQRGGETVECLKAQEAHFPIDTPWGRFYTDRYSLFDLTIESEPTAENLFLQMSLIPYEIYQAAQKGIEQQALEACYSDGFKVKNPHFTEGYRYGRQWEIEITASHSAEYQDSGSDPIFEAFFISRP